MDPLTSSFRTRHAIVAHLADRPLMRTFRALIALYLFMLVLLPSGSVLGINVKVLCFTLLLPVAFQVALARRQITAYRLVGLLSVPLICLLWTFVSQIYGFEARESMAQYKDLMVTICTCWFAAVLCGDDQREILFLLRWVVYAEIVTSGFKLLLLAYAFARGIPVSQLLDVISRVFGVQLMAYDFESMLGRVQFISDNLLPLCLFALLCYRKLLGLRAGRTVLILGVLLVSDLFSFSRYLWVFTAAALLCGLVVGEKDRLQAILVSLLAVLTLATLPFLIVIISLRFSATVVTSSDADRIQQVAALRSFIADAPWFGHGLGSYTHRVIRSLNAPYSYEAQLLALFGQIGIVGVSLLLLLVIVYFRRLWPDERRSGLRRAGLLLLLLGWLAGGFFNPSVISSAASVSYAAIFAMAALHDRPPRPSPEPTGQILLPGSA